MSFFCRLSRRHYWCTPHRSADNRLVQVCYECGAERPARELHNELTPELINHRVASGRTETQRLATPRPAEIPSQNIERSEAIAIGQRTLRRFAAIK